MFELGWTPLDVRIRLVKGQGWICTLEPKSGTPSPNWPVGTGVSLVFYPSNQDVRVPLASWVVLDTWAATVTTNSVSWSIAPLVADAIPDGALVRCYIDYPSVPDFVWMQGWVHRTDLPTWRS